MAASKVWPKHARNGASHAFGHIYRQVMRDNVVPNVPIYQNTFFPPNQPKAARSYQFGRIVRKRSNPGNSDKKVAVFASGGMSHFVIDEEFDRKFVDALKRKDKNYLTSIPLKDLQSGTSELKSWISLAGLMENIDADMHEIDYVPCYRSAGRNRNRQWILLVGVQALMGTVTEFVARLRKVDCCAVSDALDSLKLTGVVSGFAATLRQRPHRRTGDYGQARHRAAQSGPPRHLCTTAIETGGPDNVIVVEQRTGIEAGSWGGLLVGWRQGTRNRRRHRRGTDARYRPVDGDAISGVCAVVDGQDGERTHRGTGDQRAGPGWRYHGRTG